jgi:hypothetical protein
MSCPTEACVVIAVAAAGTVAAEVATLIVIVMG